MINFETKEEVEIEILAHKSKSHKVIKPRGKSLTFSNSKLAYAFHKNNKLDHQ
jgi:hypothetical protein